MEEINRNTRTLIVCFTVAIIAMIPLRFVELGNQLEVIDSRSMVLGETSQPVILPSSELESPYDEIDGELSVEVIDVVDVNDCLTEADAAVMIKEIVNEMTPDYLSEIDLVRENICQ